MSGTGSWLQFANRMNKFKGSYFQDFADISGNVIVRNTGNVYLHAGSNMYMTAGDISMNGFMYCKGVVDLSGNSLTGGGDGGGGGLTSLSIVGIKSLNTTSFVTTDGHVSIGDYLNVTGSTTLTGQLTSNGNSSFNGQLDGTGASFNTLSVGNVELKGSIIPDTNATYDIGSADKKIRDLYVSDASIWIGDNNKLAVENNKITMKKRKKGDNDIPKFISDKLTTYISNADKVAHVKYFASSNSLGKTSTELLSTYTVSDWIRFANKKGTLSEDGFVKTNHTAYEIYDLANDFDNDDSGQWSTVSAGVIKYDGKITVGNDVNTAALETLGNTSLLGKVSIGEYFNSPASLYINGNTVNAGVLQVEGIAYLSTTNVSNSLNVSQNANITGKMGIGKPADGTLHLDVLGKTRVQDDAYFKKSLLVGSAVNSTSLATNDASGASMYVETPLTAGSYPDVSHNVVLNVPNTVFKAQDNTVVTNTNSLVIDATNRIILPSVRDVNGDLVNTGMTNGWELGGPGAYRFDKIHARDLNISDSTINIEDASGNTIGMSFDATTGSVNYTVVTKDTADASGETFVIKGVQTQKISSGSGTIDPALLEFTGLSFGDTFDSALVYDLSTTYTYNLSTTSYTGDGGVGIFTTSAGAQSLANFATSINEQTLLGSLPTKESAVVRVGVDDRADGGLNGIDTAGSKIDLTNKIVSVTDDDGGSTLKWTLWGSEAELNASTAGNYLNYIELKNINMASGTYFVAKTSGTIVYNNATQDFLTNDDMIGVVNGDLFLYIDRSPGNNWTKIPVSLPASGSITTQMLTDGVIHPGKIATGAVTENKILNGAVTTNKIADASITAIKFKAGEINGTIFADDAIDGVKISGNIATSKLVGDISGSLITDNTIVSSKIADGAITSAKIAYLGVSGDNLMTNSVTTLKIADGAVIASKIPDGVITSAKLASGAIDSADLLTDGVITSSKIFSLDSTKLSGSLPLSSIPAGITGDKIANGTIDISHLSASVLSSKQNTLFAGEGIEMYTDSNDNKLKIKSTITNEIGTGEITLDKIDNSVFSNLQSKLTAGSGININTNTNTITSYSSLSNNTIQTQHIQDGAITSDKLALDISDPNSVTTTTTEGTFTGTYADPGVNSYNTDLGLKDAASRISSDGLTLVSCSLRNTTSVNRFNIQKRPSISHSWPLKDTSNNISFSGGIKHDFDIDSSGNTLVYLDNNTSKSIGIYDVSENVLLRNYNLGQTPVTLDLDSSGDKMAIYNHELTGYRTVNIYDVDKTNSAESNNYIIVNGNNVLYTTNGTWTISQTSVLNVVNKVFYSKQAELWMAVGEGVTNNVATSTDGINWTGKGKVFNIKGNSVYYNGGIWIAVGQDTNSIKNIAYSTDNGTTWSNPTVSIFTANSNDVIYTFNRWFVCGNGTKVYWSNDGTTWTTANSISLHTSMLEVFNLSLSADRLYATGLNSSNYNYNAYYITSTYTTGGGNVIVFQTNIATGIALNNTNVITRKIVFSNGIYVAVGFGGSGTDIAQIAYSTTGANNTWTQIKIFSGVGLDIIHDGEKFIATGVDTERNKQIQYSYDGVSWNPFKIEQIPNSGIITDFINLSTSNKLVYSTNHGTTWTASSNDVFNGPINKTYYSKVEGLWMAVGEGGSHTVATSTDGINWTGKGMVFNIRGKSVYYTAGVWVAVGEDTDSIKNIAFSTDNGSTWSNPTVSLFTSYGNGVIYALGRWFVCDSNKYVYWSYDGTTWNTTNKISMGTYIEEIKNFKYIDGRLYAPGRSTSGQHTYLTPYLYLNSTNGALTTSNPNIDIFEIYINGSQTMAMNNILINQIHYANGYYIAVGFGGTTAGDAIGDKIGGVNVSVSSNFTSWTRYKIFTGKGLDITHDGSKWIATGEDSDPSKRVQYSTDNGATWQPLITPTIDASANVTSIISVSETNKTLTSLDYGENWIVNTNSVFNGSINKTHYSRQLGLWMAVGEGGSHTVATSTDGINWTGKGMVFNIRGKSVYYTAGVWVAVGEDTDSIKNIAFSTDNGSTWSNPTVSLFTSYCNGVIYSLDRWFVCGSTNIVYWSYDGTTWNTTNKISMGTLIEEIKNFKYIDGRLYAPGRSTSGQHTYLTPYLYLNSTNGALTATVSNLDIFEIYVNGNEWMAMNNILINQIHYANGYYIAVGFGGTTQVDAVGDKIGGVNVSVSSNFTSWTRYKIFTGKGLDITHDGSKWIATGEDSDPSKRVQYSTDNGATWQPLITPTIDVSANITSMISISNRNNTIISTDNSLNWVVNTNSVFNGSINKTHYSRQLGLWMAVGEGGSHTVATSTDGINWTGKGMVFNIRGKSVYYTAGVWVAVGEDTDSIKNIAFSTDNGSTWSNPTVSLFTSYCNGVIYSLDRWFVCGSTNIVYWSYDGTTWNTTNKISMGTLIEEIKNFKYIDGRLYAPGRSTSGQHTYLTPYLYLNSTNGALTTSNPNIDIFEIYVNGNEWMAMNNILINQIHYANGYYIAVGFGGTTQVDAVGDKIGGVNVSVSSNFISWTRYKIFTGKGLDITHDGSKWIATGEDTDSTKRVQYSTDNGATWQPLVMPTIDASANITSIVSVSNSNKILTSIDYGENWIVNTTSAFSGSINKTYYSTQLGLWMAVGEGGSHTVATSTDGINWTGKGMVFDIRGKSVYYTDGVWVAVGEDTDSIKNIAFSTDNGSTWSNPTVSLFTSYCNGVIYSLDRWFVCGSTNIVYWSYDGTTWNTTNKISMGTLINEIKNFKYIDGRLYAPGRSISSQHTYLTPYLYLNSTNGALTATVSNLDIFEIYINGTQAMAMDDILINQIHYANGYYIAVGLGGTTAGDAIGDKIGGVNVAVSSNFISWTRYKIFTGKGLDITHDGSKWIATGEDTDSTKRVQYSTDNGATWQPLVMPTVLDIANNVSNLISVYNAKPENYNIVYDDNARNNIGYSEVPLANDTSIFSRSIIETDLNTSITSTPKVNALGMGTGTNTISYSRDGGLTLNGIGNSIFSVAGIRSYYNGEMWVAVGEGSVNTLAISSDGINWTGKGKVFSVRGKSVTYDNGTWIAVGEDATSNKCIAYSTNDGVSWSYSNSSIFSTSCNDIVHTEYQGWIAVGTGTVNTMATSADGISWTGAGLIMTTSINTIAYRGGGHILIGGNDTDKTRCFLYTTYLESPTTYDNTTLMSLPATWSKISNFHGWTEVERITYNDYKWTITSDGSVDTFSYSTNYNGNSFTDKAKLTQDIKCKGTAMSSTHWITWGEDTNNDEKVKVSYDYGLTWLNINKSTHDSYNDIFIASKPKKIFTLPLYYHSVNQYLGSSSLATANNGYYHTQHKTAFSGDGTSIAISNSYNQGAVNVFKLNYNTHTYELEYEITGGGTNYNMGRAISLNYDGTVLAYSYGSHDEDTATTQIARVVIYSKDSITGIWNTVPDVTLKGSDFYEYSDFIPVRKFIEGFGATLSLNSDGKILAVASWKDYAWVAMRVFKRRSGVWLPYYTGIQGTTLSLNNYSVVNEIDMTDNGQMIVWNAADITSIATIPNDAIYTDVKLAPMSGATAYLKVGQDTTPYDSEYGLNSDWHNAIEANGRIYSYPNSTTLNHSKEFALQSRNHLSFYTGLDLSETPLANDNNDTRLRMYIDNSGLVGIGKKASIHQLDVSGTINASNGIYSSGNIVHTSDDRLKVNEKFIDDALGTIMKIRPEIYDKKLSLTDTSETSYRKESGLIAQDLWYNSPELRHLIQLGTKTLGTKTIQEEVKIPLNTLSSNVSKYTDERGNNTYTVGGLVVPYEDIENENKFKTEISYKEIPNIVPVEPSDIQDVVLDNDIINDPDYTALGWGDTPASVNYNGIIPYLIKAMQEQQETIDLLKTEVNSLKNA